MERSLVGNAADPKQVKAATKATKERLRRERADLEWVVSTKQGRRVIWRFLCSAQVFSAMVGATEFDRGIVEGRRRMGLELMAECLAVDPALYGRMGQEDQEQEEADLAPGQTKATTDETEEAES